MKKYLVVFLAVAMLLSLAVSVSAVSASDFDVPDVDFDFEDMISITTDSYQVGNSNQGGHGNHQTRVVHTSYGDYIAAPSNYTDNGARDGLLQCSVIFVPTGETEPQLLLQTVQPSSTTQISIIADNDENVWAGMVYENYYRDQFDSHGNGFIIDLFRITPEGEITEYTTITSGKDKNGGGTGYASFYYDSTANAIVCLTSDGVAKDPSYNYWKVFNLDTLTFDKETYCFQVDGGRNGYPFFISTEDGGFIVVTNRNPSYNDPVSYFPEVPTFEGVDPAIVEETFPGGRQDTVAYAFDMISAYTIPDLHSDEGITSFMVYGPDYSRVTGTLEQRKTLEYRMINEYPNVAFNNGGDAYLDDDGNLHVTVHINYRTLAWDWMVTYSKWVHVVYDAATGEKLSESIVWEEVEDGSRLNYFSSDHSRTTPNGTGIESPFRDARFYADPVTGDLFILSNKGLDGLVVMKCVGSPEEGYTYEEVACHAFPEIKDRYNRLRGIGNLNGAPHRSNSVEDETLALIGQAPWSYELFRINLDYHEMYSEITVTCNDASRGTIDGEGTYDYYDEVTVTATPNPGYAFLGWYEDGVLVSEDEEYTFIATDPRTLNAEFSEAIVYTITYKTNGAIKNENPLTYTVEDGEIVLKDPVKPTSLFRGWTCDQLGGTIKVIPEGTTGDLVIVANWIPMPMGDDVKADPKEVKPVGDPVIVPEIEPETVEPETEVVVVPDDEVEFPFDDVPEELYEDVLYLYQNDIMNGVGDGKFAPDVTLNRAMVVTILWRMEGEPAADYDMTFEDVEADQWYTEAIRWAASEGIVLGYSDVKFGPKDNITNEQLLTILYRYANMKGYEVGAGDGIDVLLYTDGEEVDEYAIPAVQEACGAGIMYADAEGNLYPTTDSTRGGAAGIIHRFLAYYVD